MAPLPASFMPSLCCSSPGPTLRCSHPTNTRRPLRIVRDRLYVCSFAPPPSVCAPCVASRCSCPSHSRRMPSWHCSSPTPRCPCTNAHWPHHIIRDRPYTRPYAPLPTVVPRGSLRGARARLFHAACPLGTVRHPPRAIRVRMHTGPIALSAIDHTPARTRRCQLWCPADRFAVPVPVSFTPRALSALFVTHPALSVSECTLAPSHYPRSTIHPPVRAAANCGAPRIASWCPCPSLSRCVPLGAVCHFH